MPTLEALSNSLALTPSPALAVDRSGTIRFANRRVEELMGYPAGALVGQPIEVLVPAAVRPHHPELRQAFFSVPHERAMGTGRDLFAERSDGSLVPVEIGLTPYVSDSDGEELVVASISDITERKLQEDRVRLAMDAASSAMVMVDSEGRIALANLQTCRTFGYELDEMIGEPVEMLVPTTFHRRHEVYVSSYLLSPARREMAAGRIVAGRRKDGTSFQAEITLTPISTHDQQFVMSTILDVSDRVRRERDLQRLNEELAQFAYSASHDLKAPLTSLSGLLGFITRDAEAGDLEEVRRNAERCQELAARLAGRVEDALAIAKSEEQELVISSFDLREVVDVAWDVVRPVGDASGVELVVDFEPGMVVTSDALRLSQIIENLLSNGVKYQDPSREKRWVRVAASLEDGTLEFSVSDNGLGIPENRHGDVFKMFARFHDQTIAGSGLGLALVKKSVEKLGGTIEFVSDREGTRFDIRLESPDREEGNEI